MCYCPNKCQLKYIYTENHQKIWSLDRYNMKMHFKVLKLTYPMMWYHLHSIKIPYHVFCKLWCVTVPLVAAAKVLIILTSPQAKCQLTLWRGKPKLPLEQQLACCLRCKRARWFAWNCAHTSKCCIQMFQQSMDKHRAGALSIDLQSHSHRAQLQSDPVSTLHVCFLL